MAIIYYFFHSWLLKKKIIMTMSIVHKNELIQIRNNYYQSIVSAYVTVRALRVLSFYKFEEPF